MPQQGNLTRLEELIAGLGGVGIGARSAGPCGLLLEHLQTARRGLLGAMRNEYIASLEFAKESISCIPDKSARTKAKQVLQALIDWKAAQSGNSKVTATESTDH